MLTEYIDEALRRAHYEGICGLRRQSRNRRRAAVGRRGSGLLPVAVCGRQPARAVENDAAAGGNNNGPRGAVTRWFPAAVFTDIKAIAPQVIRFVLFIVFSVANSEYDAVANDSDWIQSRKLQ